MRHLKLYEQFSSTSSIEDQINKILSNGDFVHRVQSIYNTLPSKIKNFFNQDRIDAVPLIKMEKKYNIFKKVKSLYDKGIRNYQDIMNRIFPKNESLIVALIIIAGALVTIGLVILSGWGFLKVTDWDYLGGLDIVLGLILFFCITGSFAGGFASTINFVEKRIKYEQTREIPKDVRMEDLKKEIKKVVIDSGVKTDTVTLYMDENGNYQVKIVTDDSNW